MEHEISDASYGKGSVRALTWTQDDNGQTARDLDLQIIVRGDFTDSFRLGANHAILPSDSLRRHALAECAQQVELGPEALLDRICRRILAANPAIADVTATATISIWRSQGDHTFVLSPWRETVQVHADRTSLSETTSGIIDLTIMMTTGSSFGGFFRDDLTTQAAATDRPVMGTLSAEWTHSAAHVLRPGLGDAIRETLVRAMTDRSSAAVQQLLTDVGELTLDALPELASICLRFDSTSMAPVPADLPGLLGHPAYEIGTGAVGLTQISLVRAGRLPEQLAHITQEQRDPA